MTSRARTLVFVTSCVVYVVQEERLIGGATPIAATPAPLTPTGGATVEHASIEVTPSDTAGAVTNDSGEDDVTLYMPGVVLFIEEEDDDVT